METNDEKLSLINVKGGAALEAFDIRMTEVLDNLADPNTTDKKREITLKVSFTPDSDRQFVKIGVSCRAGLAPDKEITTHAAISKGGGRVALHELVRMEQTPMFTDNVKSIDEGRK